MSGGLPLSLVLVDFDNLLSLLMIIPAITRFFIWNIILNYCKYILILQKWLKLNFPNISKFFDLIMLLSTLNMLSKLFCSYGTIHQLTCPSTFQQNGRAEWKLCHILDTVRALLLSVKVLAPFWGKAALHVVHAINHIPSPVIQNQTPYECLFGSPLDYHHLCSFSSACLVLLQPHEHNKLEFRSRLCCFLSYDETQKGYRCYNPASHRLHISCNVVFWEHRSFVELSYFRASLSSFFVLDLFPNEAHIPSIAAPNSPVVAPDSPINFSIQPLGIIDSFPSSPFNE